MVQIITTVISGIAAVAAAWLAASNKREADKARERAEIRAEESRLSMDLMSAAVQLAQATSLAVEHGKINGEMAASREHATKALGAYWNFVNRQTAKTLAEI